MRKFDWSPLVKEVHPALDPLASMIPHDQQARCLPALEALANFVGEARQQLLPVMQAAEENATDEHLFARYERQLCLPLEELKGRVAGRLVASVAVTGSDPAFRLGTGVTVLMEATPGSADALAAAVSGVIAENAGKNAGAAAISGQIGGLSYSGFRSADRSTCVYLAKVAKGILVTNSPQQLAVISGTDEAHSLAAMDEYKFFRSRYVRGDGEETALLVISDDTLRRWCGAKLRIAGAWRTRAAAMLADLQAGHLVDPHAAVAAPKGGAIDLGEVSAAGEAVVSSRFNTYGFVTPAEELEIVKAPASDVDAYQRWRDSYQQNWRQYFDPIAARFSISKGEVGADVTVMPLIENSAYKQEGFSYLKGKIPASGGIRTRICWNWRWGWTCRSRRCRRRYRRRCHSCGRNRQGSICWGGSGVISACTWMTIRCGRRSAR